MSYFFSILLFAVLSAASPAFYQGYLTPKLMSFCVLAVVCSGFLLIKRDVVLAPRQITVFAAGYIGWAGLLAMFTTAPLTSFYYPLLAASLFIFYIALLNLDETGLRRILYAVIATAFAQALIVYAGLFEIDLFLLSTLPTDGKRVVGSVGNPEFLATLMGFSILAILHLWPRDSGRTQKLFLSLGILLLVGGIVAAKSKGTLALLMLFLLWRLTGRTWPVVVSAAAGAGFVLWAFPDSVLGRTFLWITGAKMVLSNPLMGVGPGQFGYHYLESVHTLLSQSTWLSDTFGSYTGHVLDAHNIVLNHWIELGIPGLIASVLLLVYCPRLCRGNAIYLSAALAFLLAKSLYTVMLNSLTGAVLLAIAIAALTPKPRLTRVRWRVAWAGPAVASPAALVLFTTSAGLSDFHHQRGMESLMLSNTESAQRHFELSRAYNPENSEAYLGMANVAYQNNRIAILKKNINNTLRYERSMDSYKISAHMLFFRRQYADALPLYEYINIAFPTHLTTMGKLALIHLARGENAKASKFAKRLLDTNPRVKNDSDERNYKIGHYVLQKLGKLPRKHNKRP